MKEALVTLLGTMGVLGSNQGNEAVEVFSRSHRTIQQGFMRVVILPILVHLAKKYEEGNYDLRNQASCEVAAKMIAAVKEEDRYLPFV